MVLSDTINVMLLTHPFYATFTRKPIADASNSSQMLLCISCESPAEVDQITDAAAAAGGKVDLSQEDQAKGGPMYGRDFEDPGRPSVGADVDGPDVRRTGRPPGRTGGNRIRRVTFEG